VEDRLVGFVGALEGAQLHADIIVGAVCAGELVQTPLQRSLTCLSDVVIVLQIGDDAGDLGGYALRDVAMFGPGIDEERMIVAIAGGEISLLAGDFALLGSR